MDGRGVADWRKEAQKERSQAGCASLLAFVCLVIVCWMVLGNFAQALGVSCVLALMVSFVAISHESQARAARYEFQHGAEQAAKERAEENG